jgi:hypothetical protein
MNGGRLGFSGARRVKRYAFVASIGKVFTVGKTQNFIALQATFLDGIRTRIFISYGDKDRITAVREIKEE